MQAYKRQSGLHPTLVPGFYNLTDKEIHTELVVFYYEGNHNHNYSVHLADTWLETIKEQLPYNYKNNPAK